MRQPLDTLLGIVSLGPAYTVALLALLRHPNPFVILWLVFPVMDVLSVDTNSSRLIVCALALHSDFVTVQGAHAIQGESHPRQS